MNTQLSYPALLADFERRYRNDHQQEHGLLLAHDGTVVVQRSGDYDSVEFKPDELQLARGGFVTHTHPRALPPSLADLTLAAEYGMTLRAVGISPEGEQWEYTVRFPVASREIADKIALNFDNWQEEAEHHLAKHDITDLQWERESRDRAVHKAADTYGFEYVRILKNGKLSETNRAERARLGMLADTDRILKERVFDALRHDIYRSLSRYGSGPLPKSAITHIQADIDAAVQHVMLGKPDMHGTVAPYSIVRGEVVPRSIYMVTLWGLMRTAAAQAVDKHAAMMKARLPEDLRRILENATISPFEQTVSEAEDDKPTYDPLHLWMGPDKKQLGDRIWQAAGDLSRKLKAFVTTAVASNKTAVEVDAGMKTFLDGAGGYEPMRLGRTMTAFAYAQADSAAAQGNPFVETYSFYTAPSHKCCDLCDDYEAGGPYDKDDTLHLPPVHPNCICSVTWNLSDDREGIIERLRSAIQDGIAKAAKSIGDIIGPLSKRFLDLLFRGEA